MPTTNALEYNDSGFLRPQIILFGNSDYASVVIHYRNKSRVVAQSSMVDVVADLAMELRNDAELARRVWVLWGS
jgi:hypothetical protein